MQSALLATAIVAVAASVTFAADCVEVFSLKDRLKYHKREATFVFDGTVTRVKPVGDSYERAATMEVHRVWKGSMSEEMTVYFMLSYLDGPMLWPGQRLLVFAKRQTADDRRGVDPSVPYRDAWLPSCPPIFLVTDENIKHLGRWRKPSESKDSRTGSGFVANWH